ncbi:MAG: acetate kinase [Floccifex porci]|uniref:Acetate kinase n=1 Tax=Floccifex porci TaxID=2606629 RepID=A0A7X2N4D1_9FIRM|nr:acetate kinase [Floccifex porci]MDD7467380.1 acetate kinase [Floccifex porci]MDY4796461.1 acetate kinase [Floccifex porci]MSS02262.1 acetate kinase [Floccifex porci]
MAIVMSVNAGSSSFKFQVFEMPEEKVLAQGNVERIGLENSIFGMKFDGNKIEEVCDIPDHAVAVQKIMDALVDNHIVNQLEDIQAIGHRMVHGGEYFDHSVLESEDAINKFIELTDLAPLHNPAGLLGYRSFKKALPNASHTFVFDTAFHQTMPKENYLYAIPYEYYEKDKVRRYGMHGTSHLYLTQRYAQITGKKLEDVNIVTCHLGNGGSITAVKNGKSFKTSMGFTPLAGIMMGTRCGDIDPAILVFLQKKYGYDYEEIDNLLNKKSGLLGVSGVSSDSRDVEAAAAQGNERAILAQKMFASRVIETVSGYIGLMGGADAIIFAGGIGENAWSYRKAICDGLSVFGVDVPDELNIGVRAKEAKLSSDNSKMEVWLLPTNEELVMARDAYKDLMENA